MDEVEAATSERRVGSCCGRVRGVRETRRVCFAVSGSGCAACGSHVADSGVDGPGVIDGESVG